MTCTNFPKDNLIPNVTQHLVGNVTYLYKGGAPTAPLWEAITPPLEITHQGLTERFTGNGKAHDAASISYGSGTVDDAISTLVADLGSTGVLLTSVKSATDLNTGNIEVLQTQNNTQDSRLDAFESGQGSGVIGYATQAGLFANLNFDEGSIGYVTNDTTATKNGTYRKSGTTGTGSWVQSSQDIASQAYQQAIKANDMARHSAGAYFYKPLYEVHNNYLYMQLGDFDGTGNTFYVRGGYLPDHHLSKQTVIDQLTQSALANGLTVSQITFGITSPSGTTDCIRIGGLTSIQYDIVNKKLVVDTRGYKKDHIKLIEWDHTHINPTCSEAPSVLASNTALETSVGTQYGGHFFGFKHEWSGDTLYLQQRIGAGSWYVIAGIGRSQDVQSTVVNGWIDASEAVNPVGILTNQTSPNGLTGCIMIPAHTGLYYSKKTRSLFTGTDRARSRDLSSIPVLVNDVGGALHSCTMLPRINALDVKALLAANTTTEPRATLFTPLTSTRKLPNIDSANKTITFYKDTIIKHSTGSYVLPEDVVLEYAVSTSSANYVYLDKATNTLLSRRWDLRLLANTIMVCAIRHTTNDIVTLDIGIPYTVDGVAWQGLGGGGGSGGGTNSIIPNDHIGYIAHRGVHRRAPENSLDAYIHVGRFDFAYAETDVNATSDGVPVLLHDDTINRTCTLVDGTDIPTTVNIGDITFAELRANYRLRSTNPRYRRELPSFEEFLVTCRDNGVKPMIELKGSINQTIANQMVDLTLQYFTVEQCTFTSFNEALLDRIRDHNSKVMLHYIVYSSIAKVATKLPAFIYPSYGSLTETLVKEAIAAGVGVSCWTVPVSQVNDLARMGVQQLAGDYLARAGKSPSIVKRSDETWGGWKHTGTVVDGQLVLEIGDTLSITVPSANYLGCVSVVIDAKGSYSISSLNLSETVVDTGIITQNKWSAMLYGQNLVTLRITAITQVIIQDSAISVDIN